ncbi:MAG TPA: DeoR/GlpR transcriptional regulator [Pasteurellaceae bacterium]|nr:DeoR/GlpR transcriptional regulator [Pasteurellaceae bacterium]
MVAKNRIDLIKRFVRTNKKVKVSQLSKHFGVTEETIRRDLEKLENDGILTRTFGGAVLNVENHRENIDFYQRAQINVEAKRKMALAFADILKGKHTIATDSSSTIMEVVKLIEDSGDITILTTSHIMLHELANTKFNLLCTGGFFNRNTLSMQGSMAIENIKRYNVEILLISCKGLDFEKGATDSTIPEVEVKRAMIEQSNEIALFADHSKFGRKAFVELLNINEIDYLVTDQKPDKKWIDFCDKNGIKLIY